MEQTPDVLIVGGGIIGLTCAYELAKAGLRVELLERGELGREASWAGAGIIPPRSGRTPREPYDQLRALSVSFFHPLSAELRDRTGIDNEYHTCGGIEFLPDHDTFTQTQWDDEAIRFVAVSESDWNFPWLRPLPGHKAFWLPYSQVRNPRHLKALIAGCRSLGVTLREQVDPHAWKSRSAGTVLLAAGAWSNEFLPSVRPVRGQMILFRPEKPVCDRIVIVDKQYLVPRKDGRVLAGSTEEPEAGFQKNTTPDGIEELKRFAFDRVPALRDVPVEAAWAGIRPGSADGLPTIGWLPDRPNVLIATGHFRAGVQLSPGTAAIVRSLVLKQPPPVPIEAFRPDRPPGPALRPAFRS